MKTGDKVGVLLSANAEHVRRTVISQIFHWSNGLYGFLDNDSWNRINFGDVQNCSFFIFRIPL